MQMYVNIEHFSHILNIQEENVIGIQGNKVKGNQLSNQGIALNYVIKDMLTADRWVACERKYVELIINQRKSLMVPIYAFDCRCTYQKTLKLYERSDWLAAEPKVSLELLELPVELVIIHYTAGSSALTIEV